VHHPYSPTAAVITVERGGVVDTIPEQIVNVPPLVVAPPVKVFDLRCRISIVVSLQGGHLKAARGLKLWPALREEALTFKRKIDLRTAHDSYEHWRESDHGDLVLACALACWGAVRGRGAPFYSF
jgi:hypothetical protein